MANVVTERPEPLKHTFTLTVEVDSFWVQYLTGYTDIFGQQYVGYWLRGVDHHPERGWICWESEDQHRRGEEPNREEAVRAWALGQPLPKGWYSLNRAAALRAWEEGVKRWGVDWYDHTDAEREDVVVQLALLGEVPIEREGYLEREHVIDFDARNPSEHDRKVRARTLDRPRVYSNDSDVVELPYDEDTWRGLLALKAAVDALHDGVKTLIGLADFRDRLRRFASGTSIQLLSDGPRQEVSRG